MAGADPRPGVIVFEQAHHRGGAATEVTAGFSTRVLEFCARHGIEHASVHTATLKKFATGKGNADKEAMLKAARRRFKADLADDNEADALWILEYAHREILSELPASRTACAACGAGCPAKVAKEAKGKGLLLIVRPGASWMEGSRRATRRPCCNIVIGLC